RDSLSDSEKSSFLNLIARIGTDKRLPIFSAYWVSIGVGTLLAALIFAPSISRRSGWVTASSETITTFAADCVTAKTDFNLGDTVCVKVTGGLGAARLNWVARTGSVVQTNDITSDPQTFTFTIPATNTTTVSGIGVDDVTADDRGVWRVY